jgi:hypothetical protein
MTTLHTSQESYDIVQGFIAHTESWIGKQVAAKMKDGSLIVHNFAELLLGPPKPDEVFEYTVEADHQPPAVLFSGNAAVQAWLDLHPAPVTDLPQKDKMAQMLLGVMLYTLPLYQSDSTMSIRLFQFIQSALTVAVTATVGGAPTQKLIAPAQRSNAYMQILFTGAMDLAGATAVQQGLPAGTFFASHGITIRREAESLADFLNRIEVAIEMVETSKGVTLSDNLLASVGMSHAYNEVIANNLTFFESNLVPAGQRTLRHYKMYAHLCTLDSVPRFDRKDVIRSCRPAQSVARPADDGGTACSHCGKAGHTQDQCFSKHPNLRSEQQAARAATAASATTKAQADQARAANEKNARNQRAAQRQRALVNHQQDIVNSNHACDSAAKAGMSAASFATYQAQVQPARSAAGGKKK